jgi:hypothetical protein
MPGAKPGERRGGRQKGTQNTRRDLCLTSASRWGTLTVIRWFSFAATQQRRDDRCSSRRRSTIGAVSITVLVLSQYFAPTSVAGPARDGGEGSRLASADGDDGFRL